MVFRPIIVIIFLLSFGVGVSFAQEETESSITNIAPRLSVGDASNMGESTPGEPATESIKEPLDDTDDYVIGVEDVLSITVDEHDELGNASMTVGPDGKINMPYINTVRAAGLTVAQLRESVSQLLKEKGMRIVPEITVTVVEFKSRKIVIFGEVNKPGTQNCATIPSLVDAIAEAGGYKSDADLSAVQILSKDGATKTVDMKQYMTTGDRNLLPDLQSGDTIIVPRKKQTVIIGSNGVPITMPDGTTPLNGDVLPGTAISITVSGGVRRPGSYPFFRVPTVVEVLTQANWVKSELSLKLVRVVRGNPKNGGQIVVDVDKFLRTGNYSLLPQLEPGDIIYVPEELKQKEISILGAVRRPGNYPVDGPISLLDALALAGGLAKEANPKEIHLTRELNNVFLSQDVNMQEFISGKPRNLNPSAVPKLMPGDAVVVPAKKNGFLGLVNTTRNVATVIVSVATLFSLYQLVAR